MATTRGTLASIESHLLESMGRRLEAKPVALGPMPLAKDIGWRPLPGFGSLQVDQVVPDAQQPRAEFAPEALSRLADSIREHKQQTRHP